MKKIFFSALLLVGAGFAMTGCNNGDYDTDPTIDNSGIRNPLNPPPGGPIMAAKINGGQFTATQGVAGQSGPLLTISGSAGASAIMALTISNYTGPDTFDLTGFDYGTYTTGGTNVIQSTSGTVIITKDADGVIQGTFHWTTTGTDVTEGTFNMPKQ